MTLPSRALTADYTVEESQTMESRFGIPSWSSVKEHQLEYHPDLSVWGCIKLWWEWFRGRYGLEDMFVDILQAEITKEIDREILEMIGVPPLEPPAELNAILHERYGSGAT